jgi:hypothetical protein
MSEENLSILADWNRFFPGIPPVGSELRVALPKRWIRFHSLPRSKRYPDDEIEYVELLARHNTVLGELAHPNEVIKLITAGYSNGAVPTLTYPELAELDPEARPWLAINVGESEEADDPFYWHFFASKREYQPKVFDSLIRLIADEKIANVLIVASDYRWLLHPYDGGMDIIAESSDARNSLRDRHASWLSGHANGA